MTRLEMIRDPGEDQAMKQAFAAAAELGWVAPDGGPNTFTATFASRPDLIQVVVDLAKAIMMNGELPMTVKSMIFYTIAERSKCRYCAVANLKALQMMGVPDAVITSCANDPDLADVPPSQRSIIKFGVKAAKAPQEITDADFEELRNQGLSDGEIIEIVMMAGYANMLDLTSDTLALEVEA